MSTDEPTPTPEENDASESQTGQQPETASDAEASPPADRPDEVKRITSRGWLNRRPPKRRN